MQKKFYILSLAIMSAALAGAEKVLHIPMEADRYGELTETVSNKWLQVYGHNISENVAGAAGKALRFDGYSTYAQGNIKELGDASKMSFSVWVAPETYPVIKFDTPTDEKISLVGTLDEDAKKGWSFNLGYTGKYSFKFFSGGWPGEVVAEDIMPCYEWSHLVAVFDGDNKTLTLYRNGQKVGETKTMNDINSTATLMTIGKNPGNVTGDFSIDTFNGVIDEVEVYDTVLTAEEIASMKAENEADLTIPASRFEGNLLRPKFHGMPGANWTNETHGMTYYNGRYHVFFQKNANGPYMTRLHWGHISSENLYDWREERIAIAPSESYDIKGCWSGCVFTDDEITGGKPNAIYTAVDYQKAVIAQASPSDEDLLNWDKGERNPIINGKPSGLSDDFRDPYFFRNGDAAYIVVGTSKDNIGAATLHKYDTATQRWSNDGSIFFQGKSKEEDGRFWEMPTVTRMENGKWLVTVTPLETSTGVHTLYWTGDINSDGSFTPDANSGTPRDFELISKEGYGLLSPTIYQHDGKTITLGIVPDKVATSLNCNWGWAHLYSFPREISLDAEGNLIQKPFSGLSSLRSNKCVNNADVKVNGEQILDGVEGRQLELLGRFKVGAAAFGFNFFKHDSTDKASVYVDPATNRLVADFSSLSRSVNDQGVYNGTYSATLPERLSEGQEVKLNIFVDGSIVDIFVNDKWATSIRVFPTNEDADGVEIFSRGGETEAPEVSAWMLSSDGNSGIKDIISSGSTFHKGPVSVFTMAGQKVKVASDEAEAKAGLPAGIYIVNNRKVVITD